MAHIEEIMLHGKLTKVIVPDSSVQEIDDAVGKAFDAILQSVHATTDCNIDLRAGGNKFLVSRYDNSTLNSPRSEGIVTDGVGLVLTYAYTANYGRQICLTGSAGGLCQRHISGGTISKWDMLATKSYAVNKAGDTMTGNLTLEKSNPMTLLRNTTGEGAALQTFNNRAALFAFVDAALTTQGNYRRLEVRNQMAVSDPKNAIAFRDVTDNQANEYSVLHTGNKPNGSYTGNGSAASRTITTEGIGSVIAIWTTSTNPSMVIVSAGGGIAMTGSAVKHLAAGTARYADGEIIMATTDTTINANGTTYYYQVL